ncbi:MAG: DUF2130 domain-containing protein [Gammaproteobacteria bacterium]
MHQIQCPHCRMSFKIDEAGYADIQKQVRDAEFDKQLDERLELAEKDKQNEVELARQLAEREKQKTITEKETEIQELKAKIDASETEKTLAVSQALGDSEKNRDALINELKQQKQETAAALELTETKHTNALQEAATKNEIEAYDLNAKKETEIQELKAKIDASETEKTLAVTQALGDLEKDRDARINELKQQKQETAAALELAETKLTNALQETTAKKDAEIYDLKANLTEAVSTIEKKNDALENRLRLTELEAQASEKNLKEKYEIQIKDRELEIDRIRDMKARLSTKMVGETLEQHCEIEFNRIRSAAFPCAYFEKDNDVKTGSKGDYIFRDSDEDDTEIVSIMFEMKNECDCTATKKKNEDFLKELDKDRVEKGCEYAVLVSLLESDSELYNAGIVDVFHRYPKMYIIRPQFFLPMITLLRNAAMKSVDYKKELALIKEQNIDVSSFEEKLDKFKSGFARNYDLASRKFETAIDEIDKSISHLQKTKDALLSTDRNLRLANNKAQDVTIKKLTRNNQTMKDKFEAL